MIFEVPSNPSHSVIRFSTALFVILILCFNSGVSKGRQCSNSFKSKPSILWFLTPPLWYSGTFSHTSHVLSFSWTKLTERFFKNTPWPEAEAIAPQVGNGKCFFSTLFSYQRMKELNHFRRITEPVRGFYDLLVTHLCSLWQLLL